MCGCAADPRLFASLPVLPLSCICAVEKRGAARFKMRVPYTDAYEFSFSAAEVRAVSVYGDDGTLLVRSSLGFPLSLEKDRVVLIEIAPKRETVRLFVRPAAHGDPLPFDLPAFPDPASFDTASADPADPLRPARLCYEKRKDTLYVYSNAPETLIPEVLNKCLTRQDVSDKTVFFTYEHQSAQLVKTGASKGVYYGYRVTNAGTEDLYVTVKNVGLQTEGKGDYLGEKEWVDFYNTRFALPSLDGLDDGQKRLFIGYFNFSCGYPVSGFLPTTYRVPAGEFIYVIGGTTKDAFGGFDVAGTADRLSKGGVANGAVLFDVAGKAEGAFYVYDDIAEVNKGGSGYDTHVGIRSMICPAGSIGQEEGYVVDNEATWIFNDATPAQKLPVTFENRYNADLVPVIKKPLPDEADAIKAAQEELKAFFGLQEIVPCSPIPAGETPHTQLAREWVTHSDPQHYPEAVGSDITVFHTVNSEGTDRPVKEVAYGLYNFSTQGIVLEMGNWMKDYIDRFTFVNRGDKPRTVRIHIVPNGGLPVLFRRPDGSREGGAFFALQHGDAPLDGKQYPGFDLACHRAFTVPPHSVKQIAVEYNLMANSCGYVRHSVELEES